MTVINTNVASLNAQAALATNQRGLNKAMEQLSTGKRINGAADDAAGLAIASKMTAQIRGLNQAVRNANDAISMVKTAESSTNEITNMLQRMRELSVQSANDTNTDDDRAALQLEFDALRTEINRIGETTEWNGMKILDGSAGANADGDIVFHVGASSGAGNQITVTFKDFQTGSGDVTDAIDTDDISDQAGATTAIDNIDTALKNVNEQRGTFGAVVNRLQYTVDNLTNISTRTAESRSRIEDADYSQATTELAKRQIIQQAATAMLAQANQQPQAVLSLLK